LDPQAGPITWSLLSAGQGLTVNGQAIPASLVKSDMPSVIFDSGTSNLVFSRNITEVSNKDLFFICCSYSSSLLTSSSLPLGGLLPNLTFHHSLRRRTRHLRHALLPTLLHPFQHDHRFYILQHLQRALQPHPPVEPIQCWSLQSKFVYMPDGHQLMGRYSVTSDHRWLAVERVLYSVEQWE
jgi:hypothetical protein